MKCVICKHGKTRPGVSTVSLQRGESTVIIKGVPAEVCQDCGEYYLDERTTRDVMGKADAAVKRGVEIEIIRYAA